VELEASDGIRRLVARKVIPTQERSVFRVIKSIQASRPRLRSRALEEKSL
jgi:hypothetical protein